MNENEVLVTEEVAENVEQTTEETPAAKTYTQEEVDAIVGKRLARKEAKIRKEYDRKYGDLTEVLKAGTGKESVEEMTDTFQKFYASKGIQMPQKPQYSAKDIEVLAKAEADEIIRGGYEDVVEEVDRLAGIGAGNMSAKDKAIFKVLAEHRQKAERFNELSALGVTEDVINGAEFNEFAAKFAPNTSIRDIYDLFEKTQPKKNIRPMGSMKQQSPSSGVKDYYTPDEIDRLTIDDLKSPEVWNAVRNSMTGGKR